MGREINLLENYPKTKRDILARAAQKTEEDKALARAFGKDFFDGERRHGYGGFHYHPRFWQPVIPTFQKFYGLNAQSKICDIGCAKGFMLHDFQELIPGISVSGVDLSSYAIQEAMESVRHKLQVQNATHVIFDDKSFDLVISINTIHNLEAQECITALKQIERIGHKSFVMVDAYRTEAEKEVMFAWNLTAKTILHVDEWKELFVKAGFSGDYYWFMP